MKKYHVTQGALLVILVSFSYLFYTFPIVLPEIDRVYLTTTTFFFSIVTGFFIAQQVARYAKIREVISTFDGRISSIYRSSGNISAEAQNMLGEIIVKHYKVVLSKKEWDYHFMHKSETLVSIHDVLEKYTNNKTLTPLKTHSLARIISNLSDCEVARKNMVMLHGERIPPFHWSVISFFIVILLVAIATIPSEGHILESVLKSAYGVSLFSVASILYHLDLLHLFEHFVGEHSAKDVLAIIDGKR
jgi:hypothetical protein